MSAPLKPARGQISGDKENSRAGAKLNDAFVLQDSVSGQHDPGICAHLAPQLPFAR